MVLFQRILNLLFIFVLCGVLLGGYLYQFIESLEPCPLCFLQRLGMIGIAVALMMNLRFGIKAQHYGLAILSTLLGYMVSLRQISLHACSDFPPPFLKAVFGLDLYVWGFIVFTCSVFACAVLLILYGCSKRQESLSWGLMEKCAFWLLLLVAFGNLINTLIDCGLTSCAP